MTAHGVSVEADCVDSDNAVADRSVSSQNNGHHTARRFPDAATVLSVSHWTDSLFSFRIERPQAFRFRSGEFVMLGLPVDEAESRPRPLLRAYSIASPNWDDELEFYSIVVPDGPLTSRLKNIAAGDQIVLKPKPVGTLVFDALEPGNRLWLFSTGTGVAPFMSIVRDPEAYEKFDSVILTHTCRYSAELNYASEQIHALINHEYLGEMCREKLFYYPTTTRDFNQYAGHYSGRITEKVDQGSLFSDLGTHALDVKNDRCMICGSLDFNNEMVQRLASMGFQEGTDSKPAQYVVEKAFVG